MTSSKTCSLWMGALVLAGSGALLSACGPQDGGSVTQTAQAAPVAAPPPVATPAPAPLATNPEPAAPAPAPRPAPVAKPAPVHVAKAPPVAKPMPVKAQQPEPEMVRVAAAPPSNTIGAITQIDPITESNASGVGAVAGGVLGGVVGHQFGKGNGNKAMTVLGAVGGAVAGHQVEKSVQVHLDNGETRTFEPAQLDGLKVGDRVRIDQGQLRRV